MATTWQNFLLDQGGRLDDREQIQFGDVRDAIQRLTVQDTLASLDHFGVIHVQGDDAKAFIQAQFSNDINLLDTQHVQFSAYCNPKGRMLAQFLVVPYRDGFLLLLTREILAKTLARLRMFVLRSAVTLDDATERSVCLGLIGNTLSKTLPDSGAHLPQDEFMLSEHEQHLYIKMPGPVPRYLVIAELDEAKALWKQLTPRLSTSGASVWHWSDIQAGLPSIWSQTVEEFVPQMMNLELIGGVSFKKGCYPGQEIVARMHYLGKPKRRMFHLHTPVDEPIQPGEDIYLADGDGQSAGKVVIAEPSVGGGSDLLAVLQLVHVNSADLRLGNMQGDALQFQSLPYALEAEN
jgi:hypothetical protein